MMRKVLVFVATAFGIYALFAVTVMLQQDRMIFPAPSGPLPGATAAAELIELETPDGERLAALWHAPEPGEPTVLFLHGNGGAIANYADRIEAFAGQGFGVLVPAWRGYPGSTGRPSEAGIFTDTETAYDFLARQTDGPIIVYGQSLGSGAAVYLATVRDTAALVLEAPYDSVLAVARRRMPWLPVGVLLRHPFRSDLRIGAVDVPILIVHGSADRVIPIDHGRALLAAAPEGAVFREFEGAMHFDIGARSIAYVIAFIQNVVRDGSTEPRNPLGTG